MLVPLGITVLLIAGPAACLSTALWLSGRYARRIGKSTHQYTAASIVGWFLGMGSAAIGAVGVLELVEGSRSDVVTGIAVTIAYLLVLVGSFGGASVGHVWLRMTAKRDPDYDDRPSVVPDVGQPGDRDDLPPPE